MYRSFISFCILFLTPSSNFISCFIKTTFYTIKYFMFLDNDSLYIVCVREMYNIIQYLTIFLHFWSIWRFFESILCYLLYICIMLPKSFSPFIFAKFYIFYLFIFFFYTQSFYLIYKKILMHILKKKDISLFYNTY